MNITKLFLASIFSLSLLVSASFAEYLISAPTGVPALPGQTIIIPITLSGNALPVTGLDIEVLYSSADFLITDADVAGGDLNPVPLWRVDGNADTFPGSDPGVVSAGFYVTDILRPIPANSTGTIFNMAFTVKPGATPGLKPLTLGDYNGYGFSVANGSINVVPEPSTLVILFSMFAFLPVMLWRRWRA